MDETQLQFLHLPWIVVRSNHVLSKHRTGRYSLEHCCREE